MTRMKRAALLGLAMIGLSGCVAYPVDGYYYGPTYTYAPPPVGVYVGGAYPYYPYYPHYAYPARPGWRR